MVTSTQVLCPRGVESEEDVTFLYSFLFIDRGGFPFLRDKSVTELPSNPNDAESNLVWAEDNCINRDVRSCFHVFFNESTENDVLMFVSGMPYATSFGSTIVDGQSWLRSSAAAFRGHLAATFRGHVFRVTNSQTRTTAKHLTPYLLQIDEMLWELWQPGSEPEAQRWYTIDQWAINRGRDHLYNDHVHWVGPLTSATLHQMLNILCPGGGKDTLLFESKLFFHDAKPTEGGTLADNGGQRSYYFMDKEGLLAVDCQERFIPVGFNIHLSPYICIISFTLTFVFRLYARVCFFRWRSSVWW